MHTTKILYIAFGERKDISKQIYFSIIVLTDNEEQFSCLKADIKIIPLSSEQILSWKGKFNFLWRVKIKAIEYLAQKFEDCHILYFDSDTVVYDGVDTIIGNLEAGKPLMHTKETVICKNNSLPCKNLSKNLNSFCYNSYPFTNETAMYNAGVIGVPYNSSKSLIKDCLELCDELCKTQSDRTYLEQLSFSMVLEKTQKLQVVEDHVIHYWGNKNGWDNMIDSFIIDSFMCSRTKQEDIEAINKIPLKKIPITSRPQTNNKRLKKMADTLFPKKRERFFSPTI